MDKIPKTKVCTKCAKRKRMESFGPSKVGKFGFCSWCKSCAADYKREWYGKNLDRQRKRRRENALRYYHRDREVIRNQRAKRYRENPEPDKERSRKRIEKLTDSYIAKSCLRVNLEDAPKELIEAKRIQIQIRRYLKNGH